MEPDLRILDRSLIENIESGKASHALAAALLRFPKEMGTKVIAEGVETAGELAVLRSLGVDLIQGFAWGCPMPLGCYAA
ncbi:EAL domain-containing protein [Pandoraea sp.]|uniref:EAL domain-containing protein n=1 Tax=Pandoraea sp. TaxID=1883445 RepID=UPI0025D5EA52|nr:EAL domain-containing protein [Pandoraea sp.]